ncbi:MAG: hypothetical protein J5944_12225 [Lentisphaeria bacterium]|nr:hypothetical protein [Lentisphaeria bacterium]
MKFSVSLSLLVFLAGSLSAAKPEWQRRPYEIITGQLKSPHCDVLLHAQDLPVETCQVSGGAELSLTDEAVLWKDKSAKLTIPAGEGTYTVTFPEPIPVPEKVDGLELWTFGPRSVYVKQFFVEIKDAAGKAVKVRLTGGSSRNYRRAWWQPALGKIMPEIQFPIQVTGVTFVLPPKAEKDVIIFDCLGTFKFKGTEYPDTSKWVVPFPVTEYSIMPGLPGDEPGTEAVKEGEAYLFKCNGVTYRYEPKTGTLGDITAAFKGKDFIPADKGGPAARVKGTELSAKAEGITIEKLSETFENGKVSTKWRWSKDDAAYEFTLAVSARNRTLIVECESAQPDAIVFDCGTALKLKNPRLFSMAYLHNRWSDVPMLATDDFFFSVFTDPHRSNAAAVVETGNFWKWGDLPGAEVVGEDAARVTGGALYMRKTDGTLNPLRERIFFTVSDRAEAVLPNIPNPRSQYYDETAGLVCETRQYELESPADLPKEIAFWQRMHAYGMRDIFLRYHCGQFRTPMDSNRFNRSLYGAYYAGGDKSYIELVREMKKLFPRVAPYEDGRLIHGLAPEFSYDCLSQEPDNTFSGAWDHSFRPTAAAAFVLQAQFTPKFVEKYGWNACYLDEVTNSPPWAQTDFNAVSRGAGMYREVLRDYCLQAMMMHKYYSGPVWSEGNSAYFYAGMFDMDYAQNNLPGQNLLLDFKLRKFNPLQHQTGCDLTVKDMHQLLASEFLFGNVGMIKWGHVGPLRVISVKGKQFFLKSYFMTRQAQEFYARSAVDTIEYHTDGGFLTVSELLAKQAPNSGRYRIRYENGLVIYVNFANEEEWKIDVEGHSFSLPRWGFLAWKPGRLLAFSVSLDGHRVDYCKGPMYTYLDANGAAVRFPEGTFRQAYLFRREGGRPMLFPLEVEKEEDIELEGVKTAAACDQNFVKSDGNLLNGQTLTVDKKTFCYELEGVEEHSPALFTPELLSEAKRESKAPAVRGKEKFLYGDEDQHH